LLLGTFAQTLDTKNHLPIPPVFRSELTGGAYMTQGFDRNLQVLTANAFQELYRQAASLNVADPMARLLLRLLLGSAVELPQVKSSIAIPNRLKEFASLEERAMLVGQGEYFEIWAPGLWGQQEAQLKDVEANSSRFAALTLGTRHATAA
jgi:MraZ protein